MQMKDEDAGGGEITGCVSGCSGAVSSGAKLTFSTVRPALQAGPGWGKLTPDQVRGERIQQPRDRDARSRTFEN